MVNFIEAMLLYLYNNDHYVLIGWIKKNRLALNTLPIILFSIAELFMLLQKECLVDLICSMGTNRGFVIGNCKFLLILFYSPLSFTNRFFSSLSISYTSLPLCIIITIILFFLINSDFQLVFFL